MLRLHSNPPVMTRFQAQYETIGNWESKWESTENLSSSMPFGIPRETLGDSWLCRLCYPESSTLASISTTSWIQRISAVARLGIRFSDVDPRWSMLIHVDPLFYSVLMILMFFMIFITTVYLFLLSGSLFSFNRKFSFTGAKIWPQQSVLVKRPVGGNLLLDSLAQWNLRAWWPRDERFIALLDWHPMTHPIRTFGWPRKGTQNPSVFFVWLSRCVEMCALSESLKFEAGTKLKHLQQCSGRLRDTQFVSASHPLAWCDGVISKKPQRTFQESGYRFQKLQK